MAPGAQVVATVVNIERIEEAILAVPASPLAKEEGARLVQAFMERHAESDSQRFAVLDVERPWHLWLDEWTLLVGCKDAKFDDGQETPLLGEWKSHKEPRRTKAGEIYKGEGPADWLEKMANGPQLGIYALHEVETTGAEYARVMVRAAVKSSPVELWPPNEADGIFILNRDYLMHLKNALLVRAKQIRAAKMSGLVPWEWVSGYRCNHIYGKPCQFLGDCMKHEHPTGQKQAFNADDPGAAAILDALRDHGDSALLEDPRLVILSASAYQNFTTCMERGRRIQYGLGLDDASFNLETGSVFHAGVAQMYREIQMCSKEQQLSTGT